MTWPLIVSSHSPADTKALAGALASLCRTGDIILLIGDLGAGKTAFAQGFAAALGVEGPVTSPTFALVRQYACSEAAPVDLLIHADVYRTASLPEVVDLALTELVEERAIALIEWGDMAALAVGPDVLEVTIVAPDDPTSESSASKRQISIVGQGAWAGRFREVAQAWAGVNGAMQ
ncbi:MAG TPA: tRNA (adenosine(37)-N6)-threonylcarbamoyltransferase complex ATPase subunit type 1 TsaE [Acidimicrobiales bacterium]|nr:tRNA (adenosine(37)-N6)-threonylcarbamoyltransferase complex ATPase subunit type 1 TsaE [Acidimicrobiales bacterium]